MSMSEVEITFTKEPIRKGKSVTTKQPDTRPEDIVSRLLTAANAIVAEVSPKTAMEAIVLKATCELLVETATYVLKAAKPKEGS